MNPDDEPSNDPPPNDGPVRRHRAPGRARTRGGQAGGRHARSPHGHGPAAEPAPGSYPVADLAAMSPSAVALLVHRANLEAQLGADAVLHLVITHDLETGSSSESGPFGSGLEALTAARRFVEQNRALDPGWRFTVRVKPVLFGTG